MLQHKDHFHGSDLELIEKEYGIKKDEIISFSANVNPLGVSPLLKSELANHIDAITSYPDREYTDLRRSIADYCKCDMDHIIVGNGSTELISLFIDAIHPRKALILGPTYSEYERSISLIGGKTLYYPLQEENNFDLILSEFEPNLTEDIDMVLLCNPNNPTSTSIDRKKMRAILDICKEKNIYVITDETYVEFCDNVEEASSVSLTASYNNIIILRGTSKFFAAPGLRLGYAITGNMELYHEIMTRKNPWMINSLAEVAGKLCFKDQEYIEETRKLIQTERELYYRLYNESGKFKAYYPQANFMLLKILDETENSHSLFERAIREKMMLRDCSTFPFLSDRYIRICFMNPEDNRRLFECLTR
ncbi:MAG: threonine-phosphate decarboxylase [Lachnospiraceae bacterium]|nr:threonine-phosphate decarboxylase [Lachnospiraceae bacterium]